MHVPLFFTAACSQPPHSAHWQFDIFNPIPSIRTPFLPVPPSNWILNHLSPLLPRTRFWPPLLFSSSPSVRPSSSKIPNRLSRGVEPSAGRANERTSEEYHCWSQSVSKAEFGGERSVCVCSVRQHWKLPIAPKRESTKRSSYQIAGKSFSILL